MEAHARRIRVCMLTSSFPRRVGDYSGVFILQLARELVRKQLLVTAIAPHEEILPRSENIEGIHVRRFVYLVPTRLQSLAYSGGIPAKLRRPSLVWLQIPCFLLSFLLVALRASRDADIIHAHWIISGLIALILRPVRRKPIVLTIHGSDLNLLLSSRLLRALARMVLTHVDYTIAVSRELASRASSLGLKDGRVAWIPNGVEIEWNRNGLEERKQAFDSTLVWVGRMSSEKGLDVLIHALELVKDSIQEVSLLLVGDGPDKVSLKALVAARGLESNVRFLGEVPHHNVPACLASGDVFVLPSLSEGLPIALLEAMAAAKPVIASRVGGIPDVVRTEEPFQNGMLVQPGDPVELSHAILALLKDPDLAQKMGANGCILVRDSYSWAGVAERTIAVYERLLTT